MVICRLCNNIIGNTYSIQCHKCNEWIHKKCANLTSEEFRMFEKEQKNSKGHRFQCSLCTPVIQPNEAVAEDNRSSFNSIDIKKIINEAVNHAMTEFVRANNKQFQTLQTNIKDLINKIDLMDSEIKLLREHNSELSKLLSIKHPNGVPQPTNHTSTTEPNDEIKLCPQELSKPEKSFNTQRNRNVKDKIIGSHEDTNFTSSTLNDKANKKIWIFASRVADGVTAESFQDFFARRLNTTENTIQVKKLDTWHKRNNNNCFLIGLESKYQKEAYNANIWPKGVAFSRFNFRIGQRFLDNPRPHIGDNEEQQDFRLQMK